ncbi:MAG: DUF4167 domain-containing protein [Maricaulaceae bacterium]|nr:DUF4167 domain-containing protein [Maricaulaceae bacterium]
MKPGGNQGNRSFESNGPDVKIRGNAAQIYDKYLQLARDASSSGDRVQAENYLQHADHYFRIIQASQPQRRDHEQDRDESAGQDDDHDSTAQQRQPQRGEHSRHSANGAGQHASGDDPLKVVDPEGGRPEAAAAHDGDDQPDSGDKRPRRSRRPRRRAGGDDNADAQAALDAAPDGEGSSPANAA